MTPKRKAAQAHILKVLGMLDPSGHNTKLYTEKFKAMSDKQFDDYMKAMRDGKASLYFTFVNLKDKADQSRYLKVAEDLGIPIFSRIRKTDPVTGLEFLTPNKYMVLELPVRRMVQYAVDKRSVAEDSNKIDSLTGQVTGPSRAAGVTGPEIHALSLRQLDRTLDELVTARGGHIEADASLSQQMEETGTCSLKDISATNASRTAASTEVLLRAMGLDSNLTEM